MSIHRLREIYSFAGLEFSLQADKLMELKGVMLLNLKSSADGKIDINGTTYTKNDLLNIFSQEYTEESFDINTVLSKYPGLKELRKRGGISTNFSEDIDALKAESTFLEIRDYFTEHHYMDYYRCIREDIRETRLKPAADKISYMFIFTDDVLINFKAALKSDILAILREQITTKKGHYFTLWAPYYTILNHIAYDDEDFLLEQFNLIIEKVNRPSLDEAETFFRRQLSLNFSDYVKAQIREEHDKYVKAKASQSRSSASSNSGTGRFILYAIIITLKIIFFASKCSRDTTNSSRPDFDFNNIQYRSNPGQKDRIDSLLEIYGINRGGTTPPPPAPPANPDAVDQVPEVLTLDSIVVSPPRPN